MDYHQLMVFHFEYHTECQIDCQIHDFEYDMHSHIQTLDMNSPYSKDMSDYVNESAECY